MRSNRQGFGWVVVIFIATLAAEAMAYIGPGVGGGALATALGLLAAIVLAVLGIVFYPLKRFFKNWKARRKRENDENEGDR
jgi:hypothetical protein